MAKKIIILKNKDEKYLLVSFIQATALVLYCSLVGVLFWKGNDWFPDDNHYLGPLMFLVVFVTSALISSLIVFAYPVKMFFEEKHLLNSIKIVAYTSVWLFFYVIFFLLVVFIF